MFFEDAPRPARLEEAKRNAALFVLHHGYTAGNTHSKCTGTRTRSVPAHTSTQLSREKLGLFIAPHHHIYQYIITGLITIALLA